MKLTRHTPQIFTLENFLSQRECDDYIYFSEYRGFEEAKVSLASGQIMLKKVRNNDRVLIEDQQLSDRLWERLKEFVPAEIEAWQAQGLNEMWRFYRYSLGQRFKRHPDGRYRRNENEESRLTFFIYLNQDFEGGATSFDSLTIQPQTGTALCFKHELKHQGNEVGKGLKYVLRSDVMYKKA